MFCQANLNVTFIILVGEGQHVKNIRVFEHGFYVVGFDGRECSVEVVCKGSMLVVVVELDSFGQVTARPVVDNTLRHIPVSGTNVFDLLDKENVIRPRQVFDW